MVLDTDLKGSLALQTPELYKELTKGRCLSYKTFCLWMLVSIYQGKLQAEHLTRLAKVLKAI